MNRPVRSCCTYVFGVTSLAVAMCARADDTLTGDWAGWRPRLADHGVTVSLSYDGEVFANTRGGIKTGATYEGLVTLGIDADLEKLAGWSGAKIHATFYDPHGAGPTQKDVGDLGVLSNIDFYDSARLFTLWIDQSFFDQKVSVRAGILAVDEEFALTTYGSNLIHSDFGVPGALALNFPLGSFAIAAPGIRLSLQPVKWAYLLAAAYDGNPAPGVFPDPSPNAAPSNEYNRHGTEWALRHDEGAIFITEVGLQFNQPDPTPTAGVIESGGTGETGGAGKSSKPPRGLAAAYKAGFVYDTDTFSNIYDVTLANLQSSRARSRARAVDGNHAFYIQADQELWREPGSDTQGLGAFFRVSCAPGDRNLANRSVDAALHYTGLLPNRDADEMSLGFSWLSLSGELGEATNAANHADHTNTALPDHEAIVEWTYSYKATSWWKLQPDVQWIIHPGGSNEHGNALVVGLRSSFAF